MITVEPKTPERKLKRKLTITLITRTGRPLLDLRLPRFLAVFFGLVFLIVAGLAAITVYRMIDGPPANTVSGDRLAFRTSSQNRESELQRLIDRDNLRVVDLQKENQDRETEIAQLEVRLVDLGNSLSSLKTVALPGQPAQSTGKAGSSAPAPAKTAAAGTGYSAEVQKLEAQLAGLNQTIAERKASLDQMQQSFNDYNAELVRLTGKEPPLPGPIKNLGDAQALRPPELLPGDGVLTSPFGWRDSPFHPGTRGWHDGVDIACHIGDPVHATKAGVVTFATMDRNGYGLRVDISHENGWLSFYGHNSQILVKVGQYVNKGDVISLCGNTGASTGPHIHYGLHFNGAMVDPLRYVTVPYKWQ